jgi:hypothetical protein
VRPSSAAFFLALRSRSSESLIVVLICRKIRLKHQYVNRTRCKQHVVCKHLRFPDQSSHRIRSKKATQSGAIRPAFRSKTATVLLWG